MKFLMCYAITFKQPKNDNTLERYNRLTKSLQHIVINYLKECVKYKLSTVQLGITMCMYVSDMSIMLTSY